MNFQLISEVVYEKQLEAAQGYYELGMIEDAWEELRAIDEEHQEAVPVCQMRLLLLLKQRNWEEALRASTRLCHRDPEGSMGYIHAAYCLHELGQTKEAKQLLLDAPASVRREAVFYYNLGCYEVILGDIEEAQKCLHRSFEMDRSLVDIAREDPDLESLRDVL